MKHAIEQQAKEFAEKCHDANMRAGFFYRYDDLDMINAFKEGVYWQAKQNQWIKAKDQLPSVNENDISEQSAPVLVKVAAKGHYEPEILVYNKHYHVWDTADADDYSCNISDEDLWMPIPAFEE